MDEFFNQKNCDRCGKQLVVRTMSWFNSQTICMDCAKAETELKAALPNGGRNHEGCGYLPDPGNVAEAELVDRQIREW